QSFKDAIKEIRNSEQIKCIICSDTILINKRISYIVALNKLITKATEIINYLMEAFQKLLLVKRMLPSMKNNTNKYTKKGQRTRWMHTYKNKKYDGMITFGCITKEFINTWLN